MDAIWVCPRCKVAISSENHQFRCANCASSFPYAVGFPDFRLDYEEIPSHRELAEQFHRRWSELTYEEMLRLRFDGLRRRHIERGGAPSLLEVWKKDETAFVASYRTRGARHVQVLRKMIEHVNGSLPAKLLVDVGCGWGRDLLHLSRIAETVVGVDVCSFSLLMAKKLLEELKVRNVRLVLAQGEHLPLPAHCAEAVNSSATIEHFPEPGRFLQEVARCLGHGGWLFLYYPNRFSLLAETHTGIFGLGWLPRRWQKAVVAKKQASSWNTFLFSQREFISLLRSRFPSRRTRISGIPPGIEDFMLSSKFGAALGCRGRLLRACISSCRRVPGFERVATCFAPVHFVAALRE